MYYEKCGHLDQKGIENEINDNWRKRIRKIGRFPFTEATQLSTIVITVEKGNLKNLMYQNIDE